MSLSKDTEIRIANRKRSRRWEMLIAASPFSADISLLECLLKLNETTKYRQNKSEQYETGEMQEDFEETLKESL